MINNNLQCDKKYYKVLQDMSILSHLNKKHMKTIHEWIQSMPEPYKTQANIALLIVPYAESNTLVRNLNSALLQGFIWGSTEQGLEYWSNFYHNKPKTTLF